MTMGPSRDQPITDPGTPLPTGKLPGALLDRLIDAYRTQPDDSVIVSPGYGKDAAALSIDGGDSIIVKSDPITFATEGAARYLVAVNANDVVCLGGIPRWLLIVALFPERRTTIRDVEEMFSDLRDACGEQNISIIGGHTEITAGLDRPLLIGTMIGTPGPRGLLVPGAASPGDDLLLTKWIGIEGTALLARELTERLTASLGPHPVRGGAKLLRSPGISIVADAAAVRSVEGVTAMHDPTEGGLATAIHELGEASACGAEVMLESVPILPETRLICEDLDLDPMGVLSSGALLVAVKPDRRIEIEAAATRSMIPIAHIGRLVPQAEGFHAIQGGRSTVLSRFDVDEVTRVL